MSDKLMSEIITSCFPILSHHVPCNRKYLITCLRLITGRFFSFFILNFYRLSGYGSKYAYGRLGLLLEVCFSFVSPKLPEGRV